MLVMMVRFLERPKSPVATRILRIFKADNNHIHDRIRQFAPNRKSVVRTIYLLVFGSCVLAFVVAFTRNVLLGWLLLGVEVAAVVAVRSPFIGDRPWMQRLVGGPKEPALVVERDSEH